MKTIFATLTLFVPCLAFAATPPTEPGDVFVSAYTASEKAAKLEDSNSAQEAIRAYRDAEQSLNMLQEQHPDWNAPLVALRVARITKALRRLGEEPRPPKTPLPGTTLQTSTLDSPPPTPRARIVQTHGRDFGVGLHMEHGHPVVQRLREDSPAIIAGVGVGDILLTINGAPAGSEGNEVFPKIAALDAATFSFRRPNGQEYSVSLTKTAWRNNP